MEVDMYAIIGFKVNNELMENIAVIRPSENWLLKTSDNEIITKPVDSSKTFILMNMSSRHRDVIEVNFSEFRLLLHRQGIFGMQSSMSERYLLYPKDRINYFLDKFNLNDGSKSYALHYICWNPYENYQARQGDSRCAGISHLSTEYHLQQYLH